MPIMQSTYDVEPGLAYLGQMLNAAGPRSVRGRIARGYVDAGYAAFRTAAAFGAAGSSSVTDPGSVFQRPSPAAAADVDAIQATIASAAAEQTILAAAFDGVVGGGEMYPARQISLVLDAHADWDATTAVITGIDADTNASVSEDVAIPNGGDATVTTTGRFTSVTSVYIPAQSGTGGTATVGIAALTALTAAAFDGVVQRSIVNPTLAADNVYAPAGISATADFVDNETLNVVRVGSLWVFTEEATTEGDDVYVRVASGSGGTHLGAFRNDSDSSTCVQLTNAYFRREAAAGMNVLTLLA